MESSRSKPSCLSRLALGFAALRGNCAMDLEVALKNVRYFSKEALVLRDDVPGARLWSVALKQTMLTYFEVSSHSHFEMHSHVSEQITMVLEGELYFEVDGKEIRVGPGDVIAIPSNILHAVYTKTSGAKAIDAWSPVPEKYQDPD